jgi:hypothetical protein
MPSLLSNANVVTDVQLYVRNLLVHGSIITIAFKPRFALITDRPGRIDILQSCLVKKQRSSALTTT